jgi:carboxymethylenebutenolidase
MAMSPVALTGSTTSQAVSIARRGRQPLDAYFVRPAVPAQTAGVLVIHEISGLTDHIRRVADRLGVQGYSALAIDLFSGGNRAVCLLRVMAGLMLRPLDNSGLRDLQESIAWLKQRPQIDSARIGVIGFCMGGGYALALACVDGDIKAAAPFYAMNPRPLSALAEACPIVGSYPEKDFTKKGAERLGRALTDYAVTHDIKIYPGARHSFFNDQGKAYDAAAARDSWERTLRFFEEHLQ